MNRVGLWYRWMPANLSLPTQSRTFPLGGATSRFCLQYLYRTFGGASLPPPTILYSDNHLLVVNKPAGWHSVPNIPNERKRPSADRDAGTTKTTPRSSGKCLLTHLQTQRLGGGSNKDFLLPLHRIDQPCTGTLLFGKTSKAASRITKVWKGKTKKKKGLSPSKNGSPSSACSRGVLKDYLCVVPTSRITHIRQASSTITRKEILSNSWNSEETKNFAESMESSHAPHTNFTKRPQESGGNEWHRLDGLMFRRSAGIPKSDLYGKTNQRLHFKDRHRQKGKSVRILPRSDTKPNSSITDNGDDYDDFFEYDHELDHSLMRPVGVQWKIVSVASMDPEFTLLLVRTSEGARHMVRALLAQVGSCPIIGDRRYWNDTNENPNDSRIANLLPSDGAPLKDRSVALHAYAVYLNPNKLKLGSLETFEYRAPIPLLWKSYFGIDNSRVRISEMR